MHLYGQASQNEIKNLLDKSHLFLMTSIADTTGRQETQGVVTAEAQAMGLPVVAFKSGGVPFTVLENKTGLLVAEKDTQAMAHAITTIIENPERYKQMSKAANLWANAQFNPSKMVSDYYSEFL